jgi:Doubled CXXCH motif (Paired_CXXCH_1)
MACLRRILFVLWIAGLAAQSQTHSSGYVGSKACFGCHTAISRAFAKTDMGRSMGPAADLYASSLPDSATVPVGSSARIIRAFHDQNGWYQSYSEPNVFLEQYKLDYVVGAGASGLTFLIRRENYLFQAPLSFYSKTGKWDFSPGYEGADIGFTRVVPEACITCHAGRVRAVANRNGEYLDPPFEELSIGCENCHGPGQRHVDTLGKGSASIVNPAKLQPRLAEEACMACHQRGDTRILQPGKRYDDFRPGQWLLKTLAIFKIPAQAGQQTPSDLLEHDDAMKASRCFRASNGRLSCLTCHDPHAQPRGEETVAYFRNKCFTCHTDASCRLPRAARLKSNPPDNCIGCHMPKRNVAVISHTALTNHRIPAIPDKIVPDQQQPDPRTGLILVDRSPASNISLPDLTVLRAYAELAGSNPTYQSAYLQLLERLSQKESKDPFVEAALGHKALAEGRNEEALDHLYRGVPLGDATVYSDIAQALLSLGRDTDAIRYQEQAASVEPFNATIQKKLILQYINLKRYADAQRAMKQYVTLFPSDTFMRGMLARVSN